MKSHFSVILLEIPTQNLVKILICYSSFPGSGVLRADFSIASHLLFGPFWGYLGVRTRCWGSVGDNVVVPGSKGVVKRY